MPGRSTFAVRSGAPRGRDNPRVSRRAPGARVLHPLVRLQRSAGNQALQRLVESGHIQAKLAINPPGDRFEREADRVSETVMRSGAPPTTAGGEPLSLSISRLPAGSTQRAEEAGDEEVSARLQRAPEDENAIPPDAAVQRRNEPIKEGDDGRPLQRQEDASSADVETLSRQEEEETVSRQPESDMDDGETPGLQRQEESDTETAAREDEGDQASVQERADRPRSTNVPAVPPGFAKELRASSGEGTALPTETRSFFESRIGADFSGVRLHSGSRATAMSRSIRARAFTRGNDIYFGPGALDTGSGTGLELLAHELTHVVQQGHAPVNAATVSRVSTESTDVARVIQRQKGAESDADDDRPTEEQRAAALAAAARAAKIASRAAAAGKTEIVKSKQQQATENQTKEAAKQEVRSASGAAEQAKKAAKRKKKTRTDRPEMRVLEGPAAEQAGAGPGGPAKAPASPEEDPAFQAVVKKIGFVSKKQRAHAKPQVKADEAQIAAEQPKEEVTGRAQEVKAGEVETAPTPPFDAEGFKTRLFNRIAELAPKSLEEADDFKDSNKLAGVKEDVQGEVAAGKAASKDPLEKKSNEPPNTEDVEKKLVKGIPEPAPGARPPGVGAAAAAPKPKTEHEIEAPIKENTARVGDELAKENITEEQLAKSNEPQFQEALAAKHDAESHAAQSPQEYRQAEEGTVAKAEALAARTAGARTQSMYAGRTEIFGQVHTMQGQTKSKDEAARLQVGKDIDQIYNQAKDRVETILSELDEKVEKTFDAGAAAARETFEEYVDAQMEAYKEERYGGWFGWARWGKDKLLGMPDEVNVFYARGRDLYLQKMSAVIDAVVAIIGAELTRAKAAVASGRKEIADYLSKLPDNLKTVGTEAAENALSMFDSLEQQVNDKQDSLIDTLANKYQENLKALDARIEELKAANRGLVDKAIDAVKAVVNAIIELKNFLKRVLAKIAGVVSQILSDPIGFLGNLVEGLAQGFNNFVEKIWDHLKAGFIVWLTGAMGSTRIEMPEDVFSVKGMFSILMQVLGLTWDFIRKKAVKLIGEPAVKVIEATFTPFQILIKEGPAGLWEYAKEQFTDLKDMLVEQIKDMIVVQVVKAGIKWVLSLLNPVAAFIKAAMAIYEIVKFFIQKAKQIGEFIESVIDAVAEIAKGNIGGAAKKVEDALARALPLIIGLLASLLGISGIADKVQKLFTSLRKRVERFVDGLILRAKKLVGKVIGKVKGKGKDKAGDPETQKRWNAGMGAVRSLAGQSRTKPMQQAEIEQQLNRIKSQYLFKELKLSKTGAKFRIHAAMNPEDDVDVNTSDIDPEEFTEESLWEETARRVHAEEVPVGEGAKISEESLSWNAKVLLDLIDDSTASKARKRDAQAEVASNLMRARRSTNEREIYRLVSAACRAVNELYAAEIAVTDDAQLQAHHRPGVSESSPTFPTTRAERKRASVARRIRDDVDNLNREEQAIAARPASERPALIRDYVARLIEAEIERKVEKGIEPLDEFDLDVLTKKVHLGQIHARK
jgi:Domain of unknown function (DUF4157)